MNMKKVFAIVLTAFIAVIFNAAGAVSAEGYNYITAKNLNDRLGAGSPMIIIDICPVCLLYTSDAADE
jgi:hypothetical protein